MNISLLEQAAEEIAIRRVNEDLFRTTEELWPQFLDLLGDGQRINSNIDADVRLCVVSVHAKMIRLAFAVFSPQKFPLDESGPRSTPGRGWPGR